MTKHQKWAWFFAGVFLFVFIVTNVPAFNDAEGRNFGLFKIDPIDNVVHFLTAVFCALAAWKSARWSSTCLAFFGILYGLDATVGLLLSKGLLDLTVFSGIGFAPDFSVRNLLINAPHVLIAIVMIWTGFLPMSRRA